MSRPVARIKDALKRAASLSRDEGVVVEVCAGNITYRVIPDTRKPNPEGGSAVDATDDIRF